jgi:hypothetical protein
MDLRGPNNGACQPAALGLSLEGEDVPVVFSSGRQWLPLSYVGTCCWRAHRFRGLPVIMSPCHAVRDGERKWVSSSLFCI